MIELKCKVCSNTFLVKPSRTKANTCSRHCANVYSRKRIKLQCSQCGSDIEKLPSKLKNSRHSVYFCNRVCKEKAQSLQGSVLQIRPTHYKDGACSYNTTCFRLKDNECEGCGEPRKYLLEVHHKDGNRKNNELNNLEIVCANCHKIRHLKFKNGVWIFDFKYLTPRELINKFTGGHVP